MASAAHSSRPARESVSKRIGARATAWIWRRDGGRCGVRGGREPEGLPVERTRLRGKRSRRKRCPGCRCLRARWLPENHWHAGRVGWARLVAGGPRVCPWCQRRHADPSPG